MHPNRLLWRTVAALGLSLLAHSAFAQSLPPGHIGPDHPVPAYDRQQAITKVLDSIRVATARANERKLLRPLAMVDPQTGKRLSFMTNHLTIDALSIALLYRKRWQIELLFKWMKQHLHIKAFFGTTPNAVKTQLWIAVIVYVLVHLLKARRGLCQTPNQIMQVLSVTIFEKTPINEVFSELHSQTTEDQNHNQLSLFEF